jgi:hypothetical protein
MVLQEVVQPRLIHRRLTLLNRVNLGRVNVNADDVMPNLRQARGSDGAHVSQSKYTYFHAKTLYLNSLLERSDVESGEGARLFRQQCPVRSA